MLSLATVCKHPLRMRCAAVALLAAGLLAGCASGTPQRPTGPAVELTSVPFHPQTEYHCGPAALATALGASGVEVSPQRLADAVYLPQRRGSLQAELIAASRQYGRVPVQLPARVDALVASLRQGAPVLVLQNLGLDTWPRWHYAVVVGYDPADGSLLLRSGSEARHRESLRRFDASWARADRWAVVLAPPTEPPAGVTADAWIAAAAAFEQLGRLQDAEQAYVAATRRWPTEPLVWQALANVRYSLKDQPGAERALTEALRLRPSAAARNNLAQLLLLRGCGRAALQQLDAAANEPGAERSAVAAALADTRVQAQRIPASGC